MDIDFLEKKNAELLVESGLVKDIADIYELRVEDLMKLDRFAEISANNLITAIEASKKPSLERFILAMGIRHVGYQTAKDLADKFESLERFVKADFEELNAINGIGEVVAESIVAWLSDEVNIKLLEKFDRLGVKPYYKKHRGQLQGLKFVITGTLESMSGTLQPKKFAPKVGTF
jgi:DNA ligase (NAD+)